MYLLLSILSLTDLGEKVCINYIVYEKNLVTGCYIYKIAL